MSMRARPLSRRSAADAARGGSSRLKQAWIALVVLVASLVVGSQIARPNQRTIQVLAAAVLLAAAIRLSSFASMLLLVVAAPFPKPTTYGGTTLAFTLLIFILWLVRLALRLERPAGRSFIDLPVLALVGAYLLSFSQLETAWALRVGLFKFFSTLVAILSAYLVIHLTRTEEQLRKLVGAILVMAGLIFFTALFELVFPDRPLVPGWIDLHSGANLRYAMEGLEIQNIRVGGAFRDYELLAEFCAMILILLWFLLVRTRGGWQRVGLIALIVVDVFVMLTTVTRGAIFSLGLAVPYLLWRMRRHLRFHVFAMVAVAALVGGWFLTDFVAQHTRSGNIVERMSETHFVSGVPDNRTEVWGEAWERILRRPWLGYGPYYGRMEGVKVIFWPHNNYLFYWHMLGIVGLLAFLWLQWRLWRGTAKSADSFGHPSYAASLLLGLRAMFILFLVDQTKIDFLRNETYEYWAWLFFALIVVTSRLAEQDRQAAAALVGPQGRGPGRRLPAVSSVAAV